MKNFKRLSVIGFLSCLLGVAGCGKGNNPDESSPVPNVAVNVSFNINNVGYTGLKTVGNVVYLSSVGYRGIMVYRLNSSGSQQLVAFDRTCTYNLSDNNGIVVAQNNLTAICLECSSTYSLTNGSVLSGPSTLGLKEYTVNFNSTSGAVTITN